MAAVEIQIFRRIELAHAPFLRRAAQQAPDQGLLRAVVQAADEGAKAPLAPTTADRPAPATPTPVVKKKMKMDEPMEGGMMKPGMMKGDMKKAADKKDEEMKQADTKK